MMLKNLLKKISHYKINSQISQISAKFVNPFILQNEVLKRSKTDNDSSIKEDLQSDCSNIDSLRERTIPAFSLCAGHKSFCHSVLLERQNSQIGDLNR